MQDPVVSAGNFGVEEGYWVKGTREARKSRQLSSHIAAANLLQAAFLQCPTQINIHIYINVNFKLSGKTASVTGVCCFLNAAFSTVEYSRLP